MQTHVKHLPPTILVTQAPTFHHSFILSFHHSFIPTFHHSPKISQNKKTPCSISLQGVWYKNRHRPTLPHFTAVPSALAGLTSLFGMGRGGHRRYRHLNIFKFIVVNSKFKVFILCTLYYQLVNIDILLKEDIVRENNSFDYFKLPVMESIG